MLKGVTTTEKLATIIVIAAADRPVPPRSLRARLAAEHFEIARLRGTLVLPQSVAATPDTDLTLTAMTTGLVASNLRSADNSIGSEPDNMLSIRAGRLCSI